MPYLLAAALLVLAACAPATETTLANEAARVEDSADEAAAVEGAGLDDLAAARARWRAADLSDYTMTVSRSCFCPPEFLGPFKVTVEEGTMTGVQYQGTPAGDGAPPSVDGLFELLEEAYAQGAAEVVVAYHAERGYPTSLYIDRDVRIADEEIGYTVTRLAPR